MRIQPRSEDRPSPLSVERALTAMIQGRNSIARARRELGDALQILTHLQTQSGSVAYVQRQRKLRDAINHLDVALRQFEASSSLEASSERPAVIAELG